MNIKIIKIKSKTKVLIGKVFSIKSSVLTKLLYIIFWTLRGAPGSWNPGSPDYPPSPHSQQRHLAGTAPNVWPNYLASRCLQTYFSDFLLTSLRFVFRCAENSPERFILLWNIISKFISLPLSSCGRCESPESVLLVSRDHCLSCLVFFQNFTGPLRSLLAAYSISSQM